jgi:hypothetical protein
MSFPVTLRFEKELSREDYADFLEKHRYFTPSWLKYMSYPNGGGIARSSRTKPVILRNEKMMEKIIGENIGLENFILVYCIKEVHGSSPTFYAFYLWLLPNVSTWTRGYVYFLMILAVFMLVRCLSF